LLIKVFRESVAPGERGWVDLYKKARYHPLESASVFLARASMRGMLAEGGEDVNGARLRHVAWVNFGLGGNGVRPALPERIGLEEVRDVHGWDAQGTHL